MTEITQDQEQLIPQNDNITTKNDNDMDIKSNVHSQKVSYVSYVSYNNPLISKEDLKDPNGFQYNLEIINNIDRFSNSDQWYCKKNDCKVRGDKWLLMRHDCRYKNIKNKGELI